MLVSSSFSRHSFKLNYVSQILFSSSSLYRDYTSFFKIIFTSFICIFFNHFFQLYFIFLSMLQYAEKFENFFPTT